MNLQELKLLVSKTKNPRRLFGGDPAAKLKEFLTICHPDRFNEPAAIEAALALTKLVSHLYELAILPKEHLQGKNSTPYEICGTLGSGDASDVLLCEREDKNYVVKMGKVPAVKSFLEAEFKVLQTIQKEYGGVVYHKLFNSPVETFGTKTSTYTVYDFHPDFMSQIELRDKIAGTNNVGSLDGRHIAWLYKRLLMAAGTLYSLEYVHGAILPAHILINPKDHGARLIGLIHATKLGEKLKVIPSAYKDWYPKRINGPVTSALDIFLATKSILELVKTDLPRKMKLFLQGTLNDSHIGVLSSANLSPWTIYDEWVAVIEEVYGKPLWFPLEI